MNQDVSNLEKDKSTDTGTLHTLWLNIDRKCNLRCEWCYAKMTEYGNHDMSIETAKKYIALAVELGADTVVIIGGEPTLHTDLLEIVRIIKSSGLRPCLVTNGIKFSNKEFLRKTIDAGLSSITFSVKASDRQVFLKDTGRDLFDEQVEAMRNVVGSGIRYTISVTVCENLMNNFDEMIQLVKSSGSKNILIDTGKPVFFNGKSSVEGMSTPKESAKFIMEIYPKLEKSGLRIFLKLALPFCLFPHEFVEKMLNDGIMQTGCSMMRAGAMMIDPNENMLPCNHLCNQSLGKIGKDFSNAKEFQEYMKTGEAAKFHQYINTCPDKQCISCSYWAMCGSGCKLYWLHYGANSMLGDFSVPA